MSGDEIKELEIHTKIIIEEGLDSDDNIQSILQKWLDLYQKEKEKNKKARDYIYDVLNNDDIINVGIDDMKIILDMLEENNENIN